MSSRSPLSTEAEDVYRAAVERGRLARDVAAGRIGAERLEQVLAELLEHEVVELSGDDIVPLPPRAALEAIAAEQERAYDRSRRLAAELSRVWEERDDTLSYVELLTDDKLVRRAELGLLTEARSHVLALGIGPVADPSPISTAEPMAVVDGFSESIARGVTYRVVYGVNVLRDPQGLAAVQECIRAGEEARVFPGVPLNMTLVDDRAGILFAPGSGGQRRHALLVHRSGMLDGLVDMFEAFWRMAVPMGAADELVEGDAGPDRESRRLLAYLSAGLTDDSIARELGVSERTVGRRIARLQEVLGAHSRFQLGVQTVRHGWL